MIYQLPDNSPAAPFPDTSHANKQGLLAFGGQLTLEQLITAYSNGIFPWFNSDDEPILWWAPPQRAILYPKDLHISRRTLRLFRTQKYQTSQNKAFTPIIEACASVPRKGQKGTWITPNISQIYQTLHQKGYAHSFEVWQEERLIGGLYGVQLGKLFFAESMFSHNASASTAALQRLVQHCTNNDIWLIDAQFLTPHLEKLGFIAISREKFMQYIRKNVSYTV